MDSALDGYPRTVIAGTEGERHAVAVPQDREAGPAAPEPGQQGPVVMESALRQVVVELAYPQAARRPAGPVLLAFELGMRSNEGCRRRAGGPAATLTSPGRW